MHDPTPPDLRRYVNRTGLLVVTARRPNGHGEDLFMRVVVRAARRAYGRLDFLIEPIAGIGAAWVDSDRVKLDEPP